MANLTSSTNFNIEFTEEEREVMKKTAEIFKDIGKEMWQSDNDDLADQSFFFQDIAGGIENTLKGNYWTP